MKTSPFAGKLLSPDDLIDVQKLLQAYESDQPDPQVPEQRVKFGTSGHRGSSFDRTFNRNHILSICQAICFYRKIKNVSGPLFLGFDTHALSLPAFQTALEVLAANDVVVMIAKNNEFTPTPVISHAILVYNQHKKEGLADGIIITPSHNPPRDGGFKYNPTHGGPAEKQVTDWVQNEANSILCKRLSEVKTIPFSKAIKAATTTAIDFLNPYIRDLGEIIDMNIIRDSQIKIGVDPMGGAGVHYWQPIADFYKINLSVLNTEVDPCFAFMPRDWDGQIRMDPSSPYAMRKLIESAADFDISLACDTDHDRHGIVTKSAGLIPTNHYLSSAVFYLLKNRPLWRENLKIGKTLVSSKMIDRVSISLGRSIYEVPVGFKWFVQGLQQGDLGFAGEESAGASFLRKNGDVWTTDKDGFAPALLSAEMTAKWGKDPAKIYAELDANLGPVFNHRIDCEATPEQKKIIGTFPLSALKSQNLAGERIERVLSKAPGNEADIGGIKLEIKNGWLAIRPSGTEDIYKIYAESFQSEDHLNRLLRDGQDLVESTKGAIFPTPST